LAVPTTSKEKIELAAAAVTTAPVPTLQLFDQQGIRRFFNS